MRLHDFFRVGLGFWLAIICITSCASETRIPLKSDEQMVADFQRHKPESIALMKQCASEPVSGGGSTNYTIESFLHCNSNVKGKDAHEMANYMGSLNLQYVARKFTEPEHPSRQFKGVPYLFMVQQVIYDDYDTMVEEKGYIFSASPIETNVLTTGSLSQFEQKLDPRGRKDMSEIWRFKQIEPNWYLYYRHFFRAH
jgi:hypothetical protein